MTNRETLEMRMLRILERSEARRHRRGEERRREMEERNVRYGRFAVISRGWLQEEVLPRLHSLAGLFPNAYAPFNVGGTSALLRLDATEEFPASGEVHIAFVHVPHEERLIAQFQIRVIPLLARFDREAELSLDLGEEERPKLGEFLDEKLCGFAEEYLRIREPDSPYQRDKVVVDPVCGMPILRSEAAAAVQRGRRTFYFCVEECRRLFEADSEAFLARSRRA